MPHRTASLAALLLALAAAVAGSGCAPVVVAAAAGGAALVVTDRRPAGVQLDDEAIETRLSSAIGTRYGDKVHVNVTSYNGQVLLSGEVPDDATWSEIGAMAKETEHVRKVSNELVVGPNTGLQSRSNDTYVTSAVKTRMLESSQVPATQVKVVTEREVVYLMGLVSRAEGDAAGQVAATTRGVARVVKLFEYTN
jgi:osmotically-inducible protein OsmY